MVRKFKIFSTIFVLAGLICIFAFEVYAATFINISIDGKLNFYSTDIGAKIWGAYSISGNHSNSTPIVFSSSNPDEPGEIETNSETGNVFIIGGTKEEYANINANLGTIDIADTYVDIYIFIKNVGDRSIVPYVTVSLTNPEYFSKQTQQKWFDVSLAGSVDPYTVKSNATDMTYINTVNTSLASAYDFTGNTSLYKEDIFVLKTTITPNGENLGGDGILSINISFIADIDYKSNNILTVYQPLNSSDSAWSKFGYNDSLNVMATKIENNSLSSLASMLESDNAVTHSNDDYINAVVFKDIEIVNIDILTGEPIGKLSDVSYPFEWYGGKVTLPADTTLASGRVLKNEETFTVDVYTYYPTFYIRRWLLDNEQWISISDKEFVGSVKIDNYYTATFESTIFSPQFDGTGNFINYEIAYIDNFGIIPRSYAYDHAPLTTGSAKYFIDNYNYLNSNNLTLPTSSQEDILEITSNLTRKWETENKTSISGYLPNAKIAQGQNYTAYIYNYLYLIKYANNNVQEMVGYGNVDSLTNYSANGIQITTPNGIVATGSTSGKTDYAYFEAMKGGSTIGCFESDDTTYENGAALSYGHTYNSYIDLTNTTTKKSGLYTHQFLTYTLNEKRYLLDGYVGSHNRTSVFCLGISNPWGNAWKWMFGTVISSESNESTTNIKLYTSFENYNYTNENWYVGGTYANLATLTQDNYNYTQATYNLKSTSGYWTHLGLNEVGLTNTLESLVGVQSEGNSTSLNETKGLSDYYNTSSASAYLSNSHGLIYGGSVGNSGYSGLFYYYTKDVLNAEERSTGFRTMLV